MGKSWFCWELWGYVAIKEIGWKRKKSSTSAEKQAFRVENICRKINAEIITCSKIITTNIYCSACLRSHWISTCDIQRVFYFMTEKIP